MCLLILGSIPSLALADACGPRVLKWITQTKQERDFHDVVHRHFGSGSSEVVPYAHIDELTKDIELLNHGTIVKSPDDFKNLEDGLYSFVITSRGEVGFIPRTVHLEQKVIDENGGRFLGTHRSLMAKFKAKDPHVKFVGAGEFEVSLGRFNNVSDMAGSLRGNQRNFDFDIDYLKHIGAPIEEHTILVKVPKTGEDRFAPHIVAKLDAENRILIYNHPELRQLQAEANEVKRQLCELFPGQSYDVKFRGGPGKINVEMVQDLIFANRKELVPKIGMQAYSDIRFSLGFWFNKGEGVPMVLANSYRTKGLKGATDEVHALRETYRLLAEKYSKPH